MRTHNFTYNADTIRFELQVHREHGSKFRFLFRQLQENGIDFTVESMWFGKFNGTFNKIIVDDGAENLAQAIEWAVDGIREWAGRSINRNASKQKDQSKFTFSNAFAFITREWAKFGPCNDDVPICLGSTLDWLYLFSKSNSKSLFNIKMYKVQEPLNREHFLNLFDIYCWVFSNRWFASERGVPVDAMVNKTGNFGLARKYWDSTPGKEEHDQTHHFAGYFWLGGQPGGDTETVIYKALEITEDWSSKEHRSFNDGDVALGLKAAEWGGKMRRNPGFLGKDIAQDLRN